jgi:S-DNA-T family DNA segregation ATPase FtsK/SpoIIIE
MLSIGYGRAAKIIDQMERMGFVGPAVGNKPREIRITEQGYAELMMNKDQ